MKNRDKFILGGIIGFLFASSVTSGYFYNFYRKFKKRLADTIRVWDFKY